MDLSTVQAKLDSGMYANRQEFVQDIRLIITNCFTYNIDPRSPVRLAGETFERFFTSCELFKIVDIDQLLIDHATLDSMGQD